CAQRPADRTTLRGNGPYRTGGDERAGSRCLDRHEDRQLVSRQRARWSQDRAGAHYRRTASARQRRKKASRLPSAAITRLWFQCAAGEVAIDEPRTAGFRFCLRCLEDGLMQRRQGAGRIRVIRPTSQGEGLTAAAAEVHFLERA